MLTNASCSGPCAEGYECYAGSTTPTALPCAPGYVCGGGERRPCPGGTYNPLASSSTLSACQLCPGGTFSPVLAASTASTCVPCGALGNSSAGATGCWPTLVSATAANPPPLAVGFSVGDVVTLAFSSPTDSPVVTPGRVSFSPPIGVTAASWRNGGRELLFRVLSTAGVNASAVDVATGRLLVTVAGLRSSDGASAPSEPATMMVGGTWGAPAPPSIIGALARDDGHNVGLDTGDTLLVLFDQPTNAPSLPTCAAIGGLLAFEPALPGLASAQGAAASGGGPCGLSASWVNSSALALLFTSSPGSPGGDTTWLTWNVGNLSLSTLPAGALTSANGESGASASTALVSSGTWGDVPQVAIFEKNATCITVSLAPPTSAVGYTVALYWVQWSTQPGFPSLPAPPRGVGPLGMVGAVDDALASGSSDVQVLVVSRTAVSGTVLVIVPLSAAQVTGQGPSIDVAPLAAGTPYFFRSSCTNGDTGSLGPAALSSPRSVTPRPPTITSLEIAGSVLSTEGGALIDVVGGGLGGPSAVVLLVLFNGVYGPFESQPCRVTAAGTAVQCVSPPGVGRAHSVSVTVDAVQGTPHLARNLSYALPAVLGITILQAVSTAGDGGVGTSGGTLIALHGSGFGPLELSAVTLGPVTYSSAALGAATGTGGPLVQPVFTAQNCSLTRGHVEVTCTLAPGVGGDLQFTVAIGGQVSVQPRTGYAPPQVRTLGLAIAVPPGGPVTFSDTTDGGRASMGTQGGQALVFVGDYFGPTQPPLPIRATGTALATRAVVHTSECAVVGDGHTEVRCLTPPGVGVGYTWVLTVAGRSSAPSLQTTSYAPPVVTSVTVSGPGTSLGEPTRVPTQGGATVTVVGFNFGSDPSRLRVLWNGVPVAGLLLPVSHTTLTFPSLAGQGPRVTLSVEVAGQSSSSLDTGQALLLSYRSPQVSRVTVDRSVASTTVIDCTIVRSDGYPGGAGATGSLLASAILILNGTNYGDGAAVTVTVGGVPCAVDPARTSATAVVCATPMCRGEW
jgi:hypothetical protein